MLGVYGAISERQASLKRNREQMKKHRKLAGYLAANYPLLNKGKGFKDKMDLAEVATVRAQIIAKRKKEML